MKVKIYQPSKNLMQSAPKHKQLWKLEFVEIENTRFKENLMGWVGSSDTNQELCLMFDTKEAAIAYAELNMLDYESESTPPVAEQHSKSYADNFKADKTI